VMNPEVCCIHHPAAYFDDSERSSILQLLKEHVTKKGLELPDSEFRYRQPRTVFFSTGSPGLTTYADQVFDVSLEFPTEQQKQQQQQQQQQHTHTHTTGL
ncbi:unnamed protein product, partial [Polarella glacialis]